MQNKMRGEAMMEDIAVGRVAQMAVSAGIITIGVWIIYKWFQKSSGDSQRTFQEGVIADSAEWLSQRLTFSKKEVESALRGLIMEGRSNPILEEVMKIELEITKISPTMAKRTIVVVFAGDKEPVLGKIIAEIPWEDLPEDVRREFIRNPSEPQVFAVVERNN
jgi:hypothetical protein